MPVYIRKGSEEEKKWLATHGAHSRDSAATAAKKRAAAKANFSTGSNQLQSAAQRGDVDEVTSILNSLPTERAKSEQVLAKDSNGWQPLHEAARAGHVEIAELLIENGAEVNERTNHGKGGTPLWWARTMLGEAHILVKLLQDMGANDIGNEL